MSYACRHDVFGSIEYNEIHRIHVLLWELPTVNWMLYFAALELPCRSKIEGRRCCPPQRAFNRNTASPLPGSAVLEHRSRNAEAEAVSASAKRSMRPSRLPPGRVGNNPDQPLQSLLLAATSMIFLAFCYMKQILPPFCPSVCHMKPILLPSCPSCCYMKPTLMPYSTIFCHMKPIMLPFCSFEPSIFNENPRMKCSSADSAEILPLILLYGADLQKY